MKLEPTIVFVCLMLMGCNHSDRPQALPISEEVEVKNTEIAPEPQDVEKHDCGLADYPVSAKIDVQALIARNTTGDAQVKPSHLVIVRYRLDETGTMTHLKLVRPSSYGVEITKDVLSNLRSQRISPTVVDGKAVPVCVNDAIGVHLR
jgi:hypothetical protein